MIVDAFLIKPFLSSEPLEIWLSAGAVPPDYSDYHVLNVEGLDPPSISYAKYGGTYFSEAGQISRFEAFPQSRELQVTIGMNPFKPGSEFGSYGALRDNLYKLVSLSEVNGVYFIVYSGAKIVWVHGLIREIEADIFSENPIVVLNIVSEGDPSFKSVATTSITDGFGSGDSYIFTDSASSAPHGFVCSVRANVDVTPSSSVQIYTSVSIWPSVVPGGLQEDDILTLVNTPTIRALKLTRGAYTIDISNALAAASEWPTIRPGENTWSKAPEVDFVSLSYRETYWGV